MDGPTAPTAAVDAVDNPQIGLVPRVAITSLDGMLIFWGAL